MLTGADQVTPAEENVYPIMSSCLCTVVVGCDVEESCNVAFVCTLSVVHNDGLCLGNVRSCAQIYSVVVWIAERIRHKKANVFPGCTAVGRAALRKMLGSGIGARVDARLGERDEEIRRT